MQIFMLLFLSAFATKSNADQFDDLAKQQSQVAKKDPFADRRAQCETKTSDGMSMKENWTFHGGVHSYERALDLGIVRVGNYAAFERILRVEMDSKKFDLPFKLTPTGFQYIWTARNGDKLLYSCIWLINAL